MIYAGATRRRASGMGEVPIPGQHYDLDQRIYQTYLTALGREPEPGAIVWQRQNIVSGVISESAFVDAVRNSPEAQAYQQRKAQEERDRINAQATLEAQRQAAEQQRLAQLERDRLHAQKLAQEQMWQAQWDLEAKANTERIRLETEARLKRELDAHAAALAAQQAAVTDPAPAIEPAPAILPAIYPAPIPGPSLFDDPWAEENRMVVLGAGAVLLLGGYLVFRK